MPLGKVTKQEMDEIDAQAVYDADCNCWDYPDAHYDYEVYTMVDAVYDECKSVYYEEDFDDFLDYCIDNFNDYDVERVDFLEEYYDWKEKRHLRAKKEIINKL